MVLLALTARIFLVAVTLDPGAGSLRLQDLIPGWASLTVSGKLLCVFCQEGMG